MPTMKKVPIKGDNERATLESVLKNAPPATAPGMPVGFSTDDMMKAFDLRMALKNAKDALLLTTEEHGFLVALINRQQWMMNDDWLVQFVKDIRTAENVEVAETSAA